VDWQDAVHVCVKRIQRRLRDRSPVLLRRGRFTSWRSLRRRHDTLLCSGNLKRAARAQCARCCKSLDNFSFFPSNSVAPWWRHALGGASYSARPSRRLKLRSPTDACNSIIERQPCLLHECPPRYTNVAHNAQWQRVSAPGHRVSRLRCDCLRFLTTLL